MTVVTITAETGGIDDVGDVLARVLPYDGVQCDRAELARGAVASCRRQCAGVRVHDRRRG